MSDSPDSAERAPQAASERVPTPQEPELGREADRILLAKYAPAGVIVNDDLEVLHVRGRTGPYLELPSGAASFNLLKMLREGLLVDVRAAVKRARTSGALVRKDGAQVRRNGGLVRVNIAVIPLRSSTARRAAPGAFLVLFEDSPSPVAAASPRNRKTPSGPVVIDWRNTTGNVVASDRSTGEPFVMGTPVNLAAVTSGEAGLTSKRVRVVRRRRLGLDRHVVRVEQERGRGDQRVRPSIHADRHVAAES